MAGAGNDLGGLLRGHRRRAGLSQGDLAHRAGVSVRGLRDIEKGRVQRPRDTSVRRLLAALPLSDVDRAAVLDRLGGQPDEAARDVVGIGVLGPLVLYRRGAVVAVEQPMLRTLLSLLALQPGIAVSAATAIDALWGDRPPRTSRNLIQVYVGKLRRLLDLDQEPGPAGRSIRRVPGGYLLDPAAVDVDVDRFDALVEQAVRSPAGSDDDAAARYRDALRCWRGPVLSDADQRLRHHPSAVRLHHRRVEAAMALADLVLPRGRSVDVLGDLRELSIAEPLHEGVHARLVRALAAAGEQAAALRTFNDLRDRLVTQLGVSPGPEVTSAYLHVLRHRSAPGGTAVPGAAGPATPPGTSADSELPDSELPDSELPESEPQRSDPVGSAEFRPPAQLPADLDRFSGRVAALARLDGVLGAGGPARAVVITAVSGTAGVGKTALAVRWAHRVRRQFPDGQLYVNLRGFHPTGAALTASEALHGFLTALGVPPGRIPPGLDAQSALYRTLLADRRVLVLLDNARDADQVRPLLPGAPGCLVLITSRHGLTSLIAAEAARSVPLDLLTLDEAKDLLAQRLGAARTAAEPDAVDTIVDRCARLPLALAIAAARAAVRPNAPLADLAAELDDGRGGLDALTTGEPGTDVRAVFSWSYRMLRPAAARLFRLLGLHPGADISAPAAASLAGLAPAQVAPLLAELTGAHLLAEPLPGRYAFHDLLQAYAADLAGGTDPEPVQRDARTRLLDHYLHTAEVATRVLFPGDRPQQPDQPPATAMGAPAAARAWLDAERANLVAAAGHAAAHGWPDHIAALATALSRYLDGGYFNDAIALYTWAHQAASEHGDQAGQARALNHLGLVHRRSGRFQQAGEHHQEALAIYRQVGDRSGQARALSLLGVVSWRLGQYHQSYLQHRAALDLYREVGDRLGEASQLNHFGVGYRQAGDIREAIDHHQQALAIYRALGHRFGEADALDGLGTTYQQTGNHHEAIEFHRRAMATFRELGYRPGEASALNNLGRALLRSGHPGAACEYHQHALILSREIGERALELEATNGLGAALLAAGDPAAARTHYTAALTHADRLGDRNEQATAHHGLAETHLAGDDPDRARDHWRQARAIYADIGLPEAEEVARKLRMLDDAPQ